MTRKRLMILGIVSLQLLLMGSAFVAGRMIGEQNLRANRPAGSVRLPAQLPRESAAASGTVQRIQDNVITLTLGRGFGQGGGQHQQASSTQTEVVTTAETKFYRNVSSMPPGQPGQYSQPSQQTQVQVTEAAFADVKVGNNIIVWGTRNGGRVTAEVILIQISGR